MNFFNINFLLKLESIRKGGVFILKISELQLILVIRFFCKKKSRNKMERQYDAETNSFTFPIINHYMKQKLNLLSKSEINQDTIDIVRVIFLFQQIRFHQLPRFQQKYPNL